LNTRVKEGELDEQSDVPVTLGPGPRRFSEPDTTLAGLDLGSAARAVETASDVALVIDAQGIIRDVAFGGDELAAEGFAAWQGRPWIETVTIESRPKIEALLKQAMAGGVMRARQVNHPSARGADVPVLYSAVPFGKDRRIVAVGRDLRSIAALQQRLLEAQQSMERDYWRLRLAETRYRALFQMSSEAILVLDGDTQKILEANPAAAGMLGDPTQRYTGRGFPLGFDADGMRKLQGMMETLKSAGRAEDVRVRLAAGERKQLIVSASLFRQDNSAQILVRLAPADAHAVAALTPERSRLMEVVANSPDGMVVTDKDGRILATNRAFLELAQLGSEEQARGESLERWLGRPGVDLNVLTANLRRHGSVRLFATTLRGEFGLAADVEISAVSVPEGDVPCMGFNIRNIGRRLTGEARPVRELPRSVEQLTELVGRVSLKDLVREATDVIERLCIEAALEVTGDNRASAAEMLGLSRQSLYVKLRRYGLGESVPQDMGN